MEVGTEMGTTEGTIRTMVEVVPENPIPDCNALSLLHLWELGPSSGGLACILCRRVGGTGIILNRALR